MQYVAASRVGAGKLANSAFVVLATAGPPAERLAAIAAARLADAGRQSGFALWAGPSGGAALIRLVQSTYRMWQTWQRPVLQCWPGLSVVVAVLATTQQIDSTTHDNACAAMAELGWDTQHAHSASLANECNEKCGDVCIPGRQSLSPSSPLAPIAPPPPHCPQPTLIACHTAVHHQTAAVHQWDRSALPGHCSYAAVGHHTITHVCQVARSMRICRSGHLLRFQEARHQEGAPALLGERCHVGSLHGRQGSVRAVVQCPRDWACACRETNHVVPGAFWRSPHWPIRPGSSDVGCGARRRCLQLQAECS